MSDKNATKAKKPAKELKLAHPKEPKAHRKHENEELHQDFDDMLLLDDEPRVMSQLSDEEKTTFLTKDGLKKLKDELEYLKSTRRKEVSGRLKEAISFGDLSENSEYEEAKNEQAFIEGRIIELEDKIKHAKVITDKNAGKIVSLGSTIKIQDLEDDSIEEFGIVGTTESDPLNHLISNESPIGLALMDKNIGDVVIVNVPAGVVKYKILEIA